MVERKVIGDRRGEKLLGKGTAATPRRSQESRGLIIPRRRFLGGALAAALSLPLVSAQAAIGAPLPFEPFWVQNHRVTHLWSGPDNRAIDYGPIPQWSYLKVVRPQEGSRLYVYVLATNNYAYVNAFDCGPSGPPPGWVEPRTNEPAPPKPAEPAPPKPSFLQPATHLWQGTVRAGELVVRSAPNRQAPIVAELPRGATVAVDRWVKGEEISPDNYTWARIGKDLYGYSEAIKIATPTAPPPLPDDAPRSGRWLDVNLTKQIITAYEGRTPVRMAVTSTGRPTWETLTGRFRIYRRVENETMDGSTLLAQDLTEAQKQDLDYRLENVLHTQYFHWSGSALHYNYWIPDWAFGIPRSHGCLGLRLADSAFFWNWADIGTLLLIHL